MLIPELCRRLYPWRETSRYLHSTWHLWIKCKPGIKVGTFFSVVFQGGFFHSVWKPGNRQGKKRWRLVERKDNGDNSVVRGNICTKHCSSSAVGFFLHSCVSEVKLGSPLGCDQSVISGCFGGQTPWPRQCPCKCQHIYNPFQCCSRVYATYNSVKGSCSEPVSFTTHSSAPESPFPPKASHRTKSSLTLQWKVGTTWFGQKQGKSTGSEHKCWK